MDIPVNRNRDLVSQDSIIIFKLITIIFPKFGGILFILPVTIINQRQVKIEK